VFVLKPKELSL